MRIWSINPEYLDTRGLVAAWRECLLAQNVLLGNTIGYKNHPQLIRFKNQSDEIQSISNYLHTLCDQADIRGYKFSRNKISKPFNLNKKINLNSKQLDYEWNHFLNKIKVRDNDRFQKLKDIKIPKPNPIFNVIDGDIEEWEKNTK